MVGKFNFHPSLASPASASDHICSFRTYVDRAAEFLVLVEARAAAAAALVRVVRHSVAAADLLNRLKKNCFREDALLSWIRDEKILAEISSNFCFIITSFSSGSSAILTGWRPASKSMPFRGASSASSSSVFSFLADFGLPGQRPSFFERVFGPD